MVQVNELYEDFDSSEKEELAQYLKEDGYMLSSELDECFGIIQIELVEALYSLLNNRYTISSADVETIIALGKTYK